MSFNSHNNKILFLNLRHLILLNKICSMVYNSICDPFNHKECTGQVLNLLIWYAQRIIWSKRTKHFFCTFFFFFIHLNNAEYYDNII